MSETRTTFATGKIEFVVFVFPKCFFEKLYFCIVYLIRYGNKAWTLELPWTGTAQFNETTDSEWQYVHQESSTMIAGGQIRSASATVGKGSLTFLRVYGAGHMVPRDQPEASLNMFNSFVANIL
jgi:carboxypeptidase C (cathepsin A)